MDKKDYSSWLVVSDIDGTLNHKLRFTPKVNTAAIDRFVHALKGNFTLASARSVASLRPHYMNLPDVHTPAVVLNGAGIYDFTKEKMIWFNPIPECGVEIVRKTMERFPFLEIGIFTDDGIHLVRPRIMSPCMMMVDHLEHQRHSSLVSVPKGNWGKVIFFCPPWQKKKIRDYVYSISDPKQLSYIETAVVSFDMVAKDTHKGNAVLQLAKLLHVPESNICAIGDYYNDLDMLKTVAHPACCAQAPRAIHEVCEYHACHCNQGAVADFLHYIEKNY
ncbi:MAG: HAD family hydrolase [Acutalibacteraceae bacterium]